MSHEIPAYDEDSTNSPDHDDWLAERVADAIVELARQPGPHRLAAMQMAGIVGATPTHKEMASAFGLSKSRIQQIEKIALMYIAWHHPELRELLHTQ